MLTPFNSVSQFYKERNHEILYISPDFQRMDHPLVSNQQPRKALLSSGFAGEHCLRRGRKVE